MNGNVQIERALSRHLAAVRRRIAIGEVGSVWRPALDQVWAFLRTQPGLRTDGHNIFLYHHGAGRNAPMEVDFGVEVTRSFVPEGEVKPVETPAGDVATAVHIGPIERIGDTHDAIHEWVRRNGRGFVGQSWEIYGDPKGARQEFDVTVFYLLK